MLDIKLEKTEDFSFSNYAQVRGKIGEYLSAIIMYEMVRGCNLLEVSSFLTDLSSILVETHMKSDEKILAKRMGLLINKLDRYIEREYAFLPDDLKIANQIREDFERSKPMIEEMMEVKNEEKSSTE